MKARLIKIIIKSISSGSSGNCYYVSDGETNILLDCGIPVQKIKEFLWDEGKRLSDIDACLVTHSHGDHVKSAQKLADMGIDVYASKETIEAAGLSSNIRPVLLMDITVIKGHQLSFMAFDVEHDAPGTLGFIIKDVLRAEFLAYITDTPFCKYRFDGVSYLMIEANHDPNILARNVADGVITAEHAKRVAQNHMSIDTCLKTIERMDRSRLKEIWLLHLSNDNAGADFKQRVQELTGCEVYIA